jgi:hypothetical protein
LFVITLFLVIVVSLIFAGDVLAAGTTGAVFDNVISKMKDLFNKIRNVVYVAAAFSLVAAAIGGLLGQIKWQTVAQMAAGLWILAIAGELVNYVTKVPGASGGGPIPDGPAVPGDEREPDCDDPANQNSGFCGN